MSAETSETVEFAQHAGRKYVRHNVPTPAGALEVEVRAAHSRRDASVRLEVSHSGEPINRAEVLDGWDGHREGGD